MKKKDLLEFFKWAREYENINLVDLKNRKILIPEIDLKDTLSDEFSSVVDYLDTVKRSRGVQFINTTYGIFAGGEPDMNLLESRYKNTACVIDERGESKTRYPTPNEVKQGGLARCWVCGKYFIPEEVDIKEGKSLLEYLKQAYDKYGWRISGDARFMCWVCDKDTTDSDKKRKFSIDTLDLFNRVSHGGY